jgi:hypothetical protein
MLILGKSWNYRVMVSRGFLRPTLNLTLVTHQERDVPLPP